MKFSIQARLVFRVRRERQKGKESFSAYQVVCQGEVGSPPYTKCLSFGSSGKQANGPPDFKICICNTCTLDINNNW